MDYYTPNGRPIDLLRWAEMMESDPGGYIPVGRVVGRTNVAPRLQVSTVWLGLDHSFKRFLPDEEPMPLIFETMVFRHGSWHDLYMDRYATIEEAVAGHYRVVRLARRWGWTWPIYDWFRRAWWRLPRWMRRGWRS